MTENSDSAPTGQAYVFAHLRPLSRCRDCDRPATKQLFSGVNAPMNVFCDRHAKPALKRFKEGR